MAKLKGIIKLEGTLDNLTFYKGQEGYLVKTKGGVSKERIQNDLRLNVLVKMVQNLEVLHPLVNY
ncbi:hypothetical protein [uncultured Algibacter sp.]|uniref:hypothetical protein n=1 Tax=uncultured Algibacter sp. TaxID=298659 RepID=UPI0030EB4CE5|tara:strand:+ start:46 stop:240 length:195 start_codon:yes stop_codon:yes gene_type:complete